LLTTPTFLFVDDGSDIIETCLKRVGTKLTHTNAQFFLIN